MQTAEATLSTSGEKIRLAGQNRLRLLGLCFGGAFLAIGLQLSYLSLVKRYLSPVQSVVMREERLPRPDIVDRNGVVLATDIAVPSLFADPRKIIDVDEAVELLTATDPSLDAKILRSKLSNTKKGFVWLKREVSPAEREAIYNLGIPGIEFRNETKRVYPMGRLAAHILGYVDVDSHGIAGIEKFLDDQGALYTASLADPEKHTAMPAELSIDMRVQHVLADELEKAIAKFRAIAGGGIILDAETGEVIAMASFPDFNPNDQDKNFKSTQMNKMMSGVFELGSVIKAVTFAMTFDYGIANLESRYDARSALVIGRQRINDFHAERRVLTVPEIFTYSSNIGTAKMALEVGIERHQEFLKRVGLFDKVVTEVPETARPLLPRHWSRIVSATAAFGHGFAVQPLQGASVVAALLNGGNLVTPTFLRRDKEQALAQGQIVVKPETVEKMRYLFRLNVEKGTATKANIPGFRVGGKTGTAEKVVNGRYSKTQSLTSFIGAFPMEAPRYVLLVMLDEPKATPETYGFATSGWNAAPTAGNIVARIAPMLDVEPTIGEIERQQLEKMAKAEEKKH